jgi:NADPH-dependent ferric siderophore reductase
MSFLNSLARQVLQTATVTAAEPIARHAYRIRLSGPALALPAYVPGQTLNVFFDLAGPAEALRKRTYSIWQHEPAGPQGPSVDLAVCTYSDGPGARWAARCRPGDAVHFHGPGGRFLLDDAAPAYALLGDVSCLSHFYALRRAMPAGVPVVSVIHAPAAADFFPDLDGTWPLHGVVAGQLSAADYLAAAEAQGLRALPQALVYWGGPQRTCVAGHRLLAQQWRWPGRQLRSKPFWK